jgi:antitoxin component YwqK of YwqJK toxin-antitoxin module
MGIKRAISILGIFLAMYSCNGKLEQEIDSSWPDGTPQKVVYYDMAGGERVKVREERFYEDGSKEMVGGYHGIKKEGDWIYWFQDGKEWSQASYDNDIKVGKAIVWREDGNKNYEGTYSTGKPHGTWIFYDTDGSRLKEVLFEYGVKINEIAFKQTVPIQMPKGDSVKVKIE